MLWLWWDSNSHFIANSLLRNYTRSHAIAKITARCAQHMNALKIVYCVSAKSDDDCARISTLQSYHYSAVKLFSKCSNQCDQTDGRYTAASPRGKTRETKCRRYYRYRRYL